MKQILTISLAAAALAAACALTSCEKKGNGKLDPSAKVYITAAKSAQAAPSKTTGKTLTPREIVEKAQSIRTNKWSLSVMEWNRDIANTRFIVGSDWAITEFGELSKTIIEARDYAFVTLDDHNNAKDTIAYIPNEVMVKAEKEIRAAYAEGNYTECYRLLQEAFVFVPSDDVQ